MKSAFFCFYRHGRRKQKEKEKEKEQYGHSQSRGWISYPAEKQKLSAPVAGTVDLHDHLQRLELCHARPDRGRYSFHHVDRPGYHHLQSACCALRRACRCLRRPHG